MAAPRLVVELTIGGEDVTTLMAIARSRTEPASRVERARMLLAYRDEPSFFAVGRLLGVHHQTVQRCIERAAALGPLAALDDSARPGKMATITPEAKAWLVSLACQKAKDFGYPHELWTTRLLARHAREHGPAAGHECLAKLVQGTVCKILDAHAVKPHRIRYYLERRDPEFEEKMAHVLCIYREVEILKEANVPSDAVAIISYDEKPGMQAIGSTAPDLPPKPGVHAAFARDHEYKRHGTLSLLAGIDLVTGKVHALVKDRHRSCEFIEFLQLLDSASRLQPRSRLSSTTIQPTLRRKPKPGSLPNPKAASNLLSPPSMVPGSISLRASSASWRAPCSDASKSLPNKSLRSASWPPKRTSTNSLSCILGLTNSKVLLNMIRFSETLY